jgi:hypothetical protein
VFREDGEHAPLMNRLQMEETVPREQAVERASKVQVPHVGNEPLVRRKALLAMDHLTPVSIWPSMSSTACETPPSGPAVKVSVPPVTRITKELAPVG